MRTHLRGTFYSNEGERCPEKRNLLTTLGFLTAGFQDSDTTDFCGALPWQYEQTNICLRSQAFEASQETWS